MSGVEHNEANIADLAVPLYELKERLAKLEVETTRFQMDAVEEFSTLVSKKLNLDLKGYLPKLYKKIEDLQ